MNASFEDQIEKLNIKVRETKELLKLFQNGKDYFERKIKKLKAEYGREKIENLNEVKLQSSIDKLTEQISELKRSRPKISIYNDGSDTKINLEEIQLFILSAFKVNLQAKFGLIKNVDQFKQVSVFIVEDNRLSKLVMERFMDDFDHRIQFEKQERWVGSLLEVHLRRSVIDLKQIDSSKAHEASEFVNSNQIQLENSFDTTLNNQKIQNHLSNHLQSTSQKKIPLVQLYNQKNSVEKSAIKKESNSEIQSKTVLNRLEGFFDKNQPITRMDLLLSAKQLIKENYPLPFENSLIRKTTKQVYKPVSEVSPMFAIDCEMCKTESDKLNVTRISLIDEKMNVLMDEYVKPKEKIIDYLTKFSGITPEHLANVTTTLDDIHKRLDELLPEDAILIGHSLNKDLQCLQLSHPYVIDTSCIYSFSLYFKNKPSLKQLSSYFLKKKIQEDEKGHCSIEDAKATMKLVKLKLSKDITFGDNRLSKQLHNVYKKPVFSLNEFLKLKDQADVKIVYDYLEVESFPRFVSVTSKHMNKIIDKITWAADQSNSICIVILNGTCLIKVL